MKTILLCMSAAMSLALCPVNSIASCDGDAIVRTYDGNIITNTFENCVVTKWYGGDNHALDSSTCHGDNSPAMNTESFNIYFHFDSSELTPAATDKLEKLLNTLNTAQTVESVDIIGYADYLGNPAYNKALSSRRADTVNDYLTSAGYLKTRNVAVVALGENQTVTDCSELNEQELRTCLWRDRRVEIRINYHK